MVEIQRAEPRDVSALAALMEEIDHFYSATDVEPLDQRIPQITASLFQEPRAAYVLLAWEGERLAGMAAYSFLWPAAGVTRSLYIKELYVTEAFRRKGIGVLLMQRLRQVAIEHECSRIEWTADEGNVLAEKFYEQFDVPQNRGKIFYRLEGDELRQRITTSNNVEYRPGNSGQCTGAP